MKFRLILLMLFGSSILFAQDEFTLKSGEELSQMNRFGPSTEQLKIFIEEHPDRLYDHSQALLLISYNYMQLGDYANALIANEQSLNLKAQLHADDLVENYIRFGAIHLLRGNPHKALSYLLRAKDFPFEAIQLFAIIDGYLAATYRDLGQFEQAEHYFRQSIETLLIEYPGNHPQVLTSYYNLGKLYLNWGKPAQAQLHFKQALEQTASSSGQAFLQALLYNGLGEASQDDLYQAETYFRQALEVSKRFFGTYHRETAYSSLNLARVLWQREQRDESKAFIQLAIQSLNPEQVGLRWEQMPDLSHIIIDKPLLAEALGLKAAWLMQSALPEEQRLPVALANCELAGELFQHALDDQLDHAERIKLLPQARQALEAGIRAGISMNNRSAQARSFQLVELLKTLQLRAFTAHSLQLQGSYAQRERELLREIRQAEMNFRLQPLDVTLRRSLRQKQNSYRQLKTEWQQLEPASYEQRFGQAALSVSALQIQLDASQAILSYFVGAQGLYLFGLSQNDFKVFDLTDAYQEAGNSIHESLFYEVQQFDDAIDKDGKDAMGFALQAHEMYSQLLAPAGSWLRSKTALIIIPDDPLENVPFEAFLTKAQKKGKIRFHKLSYLIKRSAVTYHHTVMTWAHTKSRAVAGQRDELQFFSPVFDQDRTAYLSGKQKLFFDPAIHPPSSLSNGNQFYPLMHAENEFISISEKFIQAGKLSQIQLREKATEENLRTAWNQSKYIHMASHAFVRGASPEEAGLVLAMPNYLGSDQNDGLLLGAESFVISNPAVELLCLEQIETPQGKQARTVGIKPLTGSFLSAGVTNILYSQQLDDQSPLLPVFYQFLLEGEMAGVALQSAKKTLSEKKETAAPSVWSKYLLLGK